MAGALGIGVPAWRAAVAPSEAGPDVPGQVEADLAPWRAELARPGARIPLGLHDDPRRSKEAAAILLLVAYALAPAVVVPVVVPDCTVEAGGDCGLAGTPHLLLCGGAVDEAVPLAIRFGLGRAEASGSCLLLRRAPP